MSNSWNDIENHWIQLRDQSIFSLSTPCILINKDGDLFEITLWGLTKHIDIPLSISKEELFGYLETAMEIGAEATKQKMLESCHSNSQKFLEELELMKQHSKNDTLGHIDDILYAIDIAINGYRATPRKMLVVQMGEYRADLLLVSPPSNDGRMVDGSELSLIHI